MGQEGTQPKSDGPDAVDVFVGARVREGRLAKGLSLEKLGAMVGVTYQQIFKYENGTHRISASRLWRLTRILELDIGDVFPDPAAFPPPPTALPAVRSEFERVVKYVAALVDAIVDHEKSVDGLNSDGAPRTGTAPRDD